MSNSFESGAISSSFNINSYVKATTDAARRTRTVTIVLVVASVLVGIGYYNSLQWSWTHQRIQRAFDYSKYATDKIQDLIDPDRQLDLNKPEDKAVIAEYRKVFQEATAKSYVENVRFVRVPFFGIAFDVNDLGVIGGMGLVIVLLLMRYSLSREIKNLNISFREAVHHNQLPPFYHALAMRQVFTMPHMKGEARNRVLATAPKFICILPAVILTLGVGYDYYTVVIKHLFDFKAVYIPIIIETTCLAFIWVLSLRCWERQSHINNVWDQHWNKMGNLKSSVIRLDKDLVEEFGSDEAVNNTLRSLQVKSSDGDNAIDKPKQEQKESRKQRIRAESQRRYIAALSFASIFFVSTTILFINYKSFISGNVSRALLSSDVAIWVTVFLAIISAIGTSSTIILAWRNDRRDAREKELKIAQLERELTVSRGKHDLPIPEEDRE